MKAARPSIRVRAALSAERLRDRPIEVVQVTLRRADIHGLATLLTISLPRVRFLEREEPYDAR